MRANIRRSRLSLVLSVGMLLTGCLAFRFPVQVDVASAQTGEEVAVAAIFSAGEALTSAYEAVWDAEKTGADVAPLLERLDLAGELLGEATRALGRGDFAAAVSLADSVGAGLAGFESEVAELAAAYQADWTRRFQLSLGVSALGIVLIVVLGFFGWRVVKQRFLNRVLEMKPEVAEDHES
jgi:hypothetical protein